MKKVTIKTEKEIHLLREGGKILAEALAVAAEMAKDGASRRITTKEIDDLAERIIRKHGAEPSFLGYGEEGENFPASACISINDEVVHGVPSDKRVIKNGDLVKIDLGVKYKGLFTDAAVTVAVGKVGRTAFKLLEVTRRSLEIGIENIFPGSYLGSYGSAVDAYVRRQGFSTVKGLVGHGVGYAVHEAPQIPNDGKAGQGLKMAEGMVFALEPMVSAGGDQVKLAADGYTFITADRSLSAHFEHTVVVTENGCEILTER